MTDTRDLPPGARVGAADTVEASGHPVGGGVIKPDYDLRLTNEDLARLASNPGRRTTSSPSGCPTYTASAVTSRQAACSRSAWPAGRCSSRCWWAITIVYFLCNLVAKPSQQAGVPYPVVCRSPFGVLGANIPAIIRGLIAVAWYGIQTYLARPHWTSCCSSSSGPGALRRCRPVRVHGLVTAGLGQLHPAMDPSGRGVLARHGVDPQVHRLLRTRRLRRHVHPVRLPAVEVGWHVSLSLGGEKKGNTLVIMLGAIALVVSYFSGPMLNFGDFARYGKSFQAVKKGNFLGLPVNFLVFLAAGRHHRGRDGSGVRRTAHRPGADGRAHRQRDRDRVGALTFSIATIGINIVANFISPAFDFSNVSPQRISWRMGGMIAAVGSVLLTPWNLYGNPEVIHYTLETLGAFIGPLSAC